MIKVVIIGGGWSGVSAAVAASNAGAGKVVVLERTDMLLGTGLVGGIMRNNGRLTATEESIAMGGGEVFGVIDANCRHKNIEFPGHKHASLYDIATIEPSIRRLLDSKGVEYVLQARVTAVDAQEGRIRSVRLAGGETVEGDVFVETTGTAGSISNCTKYGNGCCCCVLRCPTFGSRVSIAGLLGIPEKMGRKADGTVGAMSGSCKLHKDSLSPEIQKELNEKGVCVVRIPDELRKGEAALAAKACQQYALKEFNENVILLDTGHAKLMSPFYPLDVLRQIPGFENARFEDPYSGGIGNSIRYLALSPRDDTLKVTGAVNLFCGGEKAGLLVGHTEAIVTGTLAGRNAVAWAAGKDLLAIPASLAIGDAIQHVREMMETEEGIGLKYTFSGAQYFRRMQELGLYETDVQAIRGRVEKAGMTNVYQQKLA